MTAAFVMTKGFREGFERFQRAVGTDDAFRDYLTEAMRLMAEKLYGWTAPPTEGNRGSRGGRKGGQAMVEMSAAHVFAVREIDYINHLQQRFGGDYITSGNIRKDGGGTFKDVRLNPSGDKSAMNAYHDTRRSHRTGRTYATRPTYDRAGGDVHDRMIVTPQALKRHLADRKKRVGKLKAGWARVLSEAKSTRYPPAWVKTAGQIPGMSGVASGGSDNRIDFLNWTGHWDAINSTGYIRDRDGFTKRAAAHVERFFFKGGKPLEGFIDRMIKRHTEVK